MDVVVVGSLNHDISVLAPRLPRPGESVTGSDHFYGPGGKGANQAVAAARLGARVAMVGRVGDDEHGQTLIAGLKAEGVDTSAVGVDGEAPTGIAIITIDDHADNTIVVSPGANMQLSPADVEQNRDLIADAPVVLAQLEVPTETLLAAAAATTGVLCLNPAPARSLPDELMNRVDVLVPNRWELAVLANGDETMSVAGAANHLGNRGATVVTLGREGAAIVEQAVVTEIAPYQVEAVDPTGAGDAFCGALAFSLSRGRTLEDAVRMANAAGALAVTRRGAQPAMPTLAEVEALMGGTLP